MLFVLALAFAGTALTINSTFNKEEILYEDAETLQKNLHRKERFINDFLNDPALLDSLKTLPENTSWAQTLIKRFQDEKRIYLHTYQAGKLKFWIGNNILFDTDASFKEGSTFLTWKNGWYEVIKKSNGDFSALAFIPIKANYPYENRYLENIVYSDLVNTNNLDIALVNDKPAHSIRNIQGKYLFSVKLKPEALAHYYSGFELLMLVLAVICTLFLVNQICIWIASRGYIILSIGFLTAFLLIFRYLELQTSWFDNHFDLALFDPKYYGSSKLFPSLGDFLLNILSLTWLMAYMYGYRNEIRLSGRLWKPWLNYIIFALMIVLIYLGGYFIDELFHGLVTNSKISFDVSNVLNLNWVSWVGLCIYCFLALNFYFFIQICFNITETLLLTNKERLVIFFLTLLAGIFCRLIFETPGWFFLIISLVIFLAGVAFYNSRDRFSLGIFIFIILAFATGTSLKLSEYERIKELEERKVLVTNLASSDDPNAVVLFEEIEEQILMDRVVSDYFKNPIASHTSMNNRLQRLYFADYLSRYDFNCFEFNQNGQPLKGTTKVSLDYYKNFVLAHAVKISDYFYRVSNTFGFQNYFALLPVRDGDETAGTLVIELKSKDLSIKGSLPELLVDGKLKDNSSLKAYSYAYYNNDRLANQYGRFVYDLKAGEFKGKVRDYVFSRTRDINGREYSHLLFKPNERKLIVISKEVNTLLEEFAAVSFMFLILLVFSTIVFLFKWFWFSFLNYDIRLRNFRWNFLVTSNRILYKTRIQVSMVGAVVFTLLITGFITYLNIKEQYREQQEEEIVDKVNKIAAGLDKTVLKSGDLKPEEEVETAFINFSEINGADLNLFDLNGNLILSSQPKIYEYGLIAPKMSSTAYLYVSLLQKSEFVNAERIGRSQFISAYVPLRNNQNEAVGYLGLPYFTNEQDYEERLGEFINALVNVYALVFVAIGFFAVFVANRITSPLTLIQKNLSEIQIGRRNEPIVWKRNDEIGHLIKEYNNMISALEDSAQKLARSERETAWREMAKQVAHEIKNPLTPLKLGVQLLEKSWKEKDPNFDRKFEKFSKSFVEQIESLAHIASEFSNFAKMPETIFERIFLPDVLEQSIDLYRQTDHTSIIFSNSIPTGKNIKGDKDQLLRCFNNLIKNAIEARIEGKRALIKVRLYNTGKNAFIEIHDNGSGIEESLRPQIFTPNFTTKSSGTGLGLAFVKQALENMGGNISYRTELGHGTTFYINIPLDV
ncbi:HAMP domain-containing histidine kinase [Flavihumibacter sp. R14]|nr:HAMP domain-containing histidine kinase [Flavihumibacter soli]